MATLRETARFTEPDCRACFVNTFPYDAVQRRVVRDQSMFLHLRNWNARKRDDWVAAVAAAKNLEWHNQPYPSPEAELFQALSVGTSLSHEHIRAIGAG